MSAASERPTPAAFRDQFDESLDAVLDINTWRVQSDPAAECRRIEREVEQAVRAEDESLRVLRERIEPHLERAGVPEAGLHSADPDEIVEVQQRLLFPGHVEAADGTCDVHAALPMVVHHSAVALVSYKGDRGTWRNHLFRRETRRAAGDPVDSIVELLERRRRRAMHAAAHDPLSELARRGITSYMERLVLAREATAKWRMGHGSPAPYEMVVMGPSDFIIRSIRVIRDLIAHGKFVFVASEQSDWGEHMLGHALRPLEFVVLARLDEYMAQALDDWRPPSGPTGDTSWGPGGPRMGVRDWVLRFRDEVAPQVVQGLYRASALAPPQQFFAHRDHVHLAARIAIADSTLNERRGFPMLIDLADDACRGRFGGGSFRELCDAAYAHAGAAYRFQSERHTRDR